MKYRKLGNTGLDVSVLSLGASSLGSVFRDIDEGEGIRAVHTAIDLGINYIDVSPYYGITKAEIVLGKAIKEIPREKFVLSTKAGRYGAEEFDFRSRRIIRSLDESLARLHTDYVDILLLHDIEFGSFEQVIEEGIPALQKLKDQGKIRYFGVSGLPLNVLTKTLEKTDLDAILSYCHYSLNDTRLMDLIPTLKQRKVGIINASPLSMGLLTLRGAPDWHPAPPRLKEICKQAAHFCEQEGSDIAKLAIQFSVSNEDVPTTLFSTARTINVGKNVAWVEEPIDQELLNRVLSILEPIHNVTWPSGRPEFQ